MANVDVLIVGAGFAGAVLAERCASQLGLQCLVVDQREHVGGNAHDAHDAHGILLHVYGPHYFRTNAQRIVDYLGQFTAWRPADYRIQSWTDGRYWQFPINLNTFEQLVGHPATPEEMAATLAEWREPIAEPRTSEDVIVSQVGRRLYEMFFREYTRKQWGRDPSELDASVCGRIPIRTNRDDRYLSETFQAMPADGYTAMFNRLLDHPNIRVELGTSFADVRSRVRWKHLVWTGMIDEYFDGRFGRLPYRSLRFERETHRRAFVQPVVQVNYPNDHDYTRTVEIKHVTGQQSPVTTIVREYPAPYEPGGEAYYPVPMPSSKAMYEQYASLAASLDDVSFVGRLATYRYYNMDQVVGMALKEFERVAERFRGGGLSPSPVALPPSLRRLRRPVVGGARASVARAAVAAAAPLTAPAPAVAPVLPRALVIPAPDMAAPPQPVVLRRDPANGPTLTRVGRAGAEWRWWHPDEAAAAAAPPSSTLLRTDVPDGVVAYAANTLGVWTARHGWLRGVSQVLHEVRLSWLGAPPAPTGPRLGRVLVPFGNYWTNNYFHFVATILPNVAAAAEAGLLDGVEAVVLPAFTRPVFRELLAAAGVPTSMPLVEVADGSAIAARELVVVSHTGRDSFLPAWKRRALRRIGEAAAPGTGDGPRDVLIVRRGYGRGFANETAAVGLAESLGFTPVDVDGWSLADQVRLFRGARRVAAAHGSALTNTIFCTPGTRLFECFSPHYVYDYFATWAAGAELDYAASVGPGPLAVDLAPDAMRHPVEVDLDDFAAWARRTA